jgi:GTPase SAR1 family protein/isopentenyldiphosphate isomerase
MPAKTILVSGPSHSGKTCLIRRWAKNAFEPTTPTIGLDDSTEVSVGIADVEARFEGVEIARSLVAPDGLKLNIWEMGAREGYRALPRGKRADGVILTYDLNDITSFRRCQHWLMHLKMDLHQESERSIPHGYHAGDCEGPPKVAFVLCGTRWDEGYRAVAQEEADKFAEEHGMPHVITSANSNDGVSAAFGFCVKEMLMNVESASFRQQSMAGRPKVEHWSLGYEGGTELGASMTTVNRMLRGDKTHAEYPKAHAADHTGLEELEVLDSSGQPYTAKLFRPLSICLEQGLLHRTCHVWLFDLRTGSVLLQKYSSAHKKHGGLWGPSCCTEVLCAHNTEGRGVRAAEMSYCTAVRALREQLGLEVPQEQVEFWFSCRLSRGKCNEVVDVHALVQRDESPEIRVRLDRKLGETIEWLHYRDAFGESGNTQLFYNTEEYCRMMGLKIRAHIGNDEKVSTFLSLTGSEDTHSLRAQRALGNA